MSGTKSGGGGPASDVTAIKVVTDQLLAIIGTLSDTGSLALGATLMSMLRFGSKESWEGEKHVHGPEYWTGLHASYVSGVTCGSRTSMNPYILTSGDNTYGPWLCLLGTTDLAATPRSPTHYDPHRYHYYDSDEKEVVHRLQFAVGADTAAADAAVIAGTATEDMPIPETDKKRGTPVSLMKGRALITLPLWGRVWVAGADAKAFKIFIGTHYYSDPDV